MEPPKTYTLPYPPSVNRYWRTARGRFYISAEGKLFRERVRLLLADRNTPTLSGRVAVRVTVHPPDKRRRDLDNVLKALFDALQHAGVFEDDSQIKRIEASMEDTPTKGGRVEVVAEEF